MSESARCTVFAVAHVEVLALGSLEVLTATAAGVSQRVVVVRSLLIATAAAAAATLITSSVMRAAMAVSTSRLARVSALVSSAGVTTTATTLRVSTMGIVMLKALVVLLDNGGLGIGISGNGVIHASQFVLSMSEEAGVSLSARTLLVEVTANLSLELLCVEL